MINDLGYLNKIDVNNLLDYLGEKIHAQRFKTYKKLSKE